MNCVQHPQTPAIAYCRSCGKALCAECERDVRGVIYCEDCLAQRLGDPVAAAAIKSTPGTTPSRGPSPGLAAALGFIPGVGAMYNGQFAKGIVHVLVFACLVWMSDNLSGFFGIFIPFFIFYMVFEAYKTAQARERGLPLPDPFGVEQFLTGNFPGYRSTVQPTPGVVYPPRAANTSAPPADVNAPGASVVPPAYVPPPGTPPPQVVPAEPSRSNAPIGAIVLIGLGVLFLLDNLGWMRFHWVTNFWPVILIVVGVWLFEKRWRR
ncbi:MAG TPA: B-box zinc finger protein [Terriglobales bacterium]|nr:B-box zinc finger protein [Terriglobales bacterium]